MILDVREAALGPPHALVLNQFLPNVGQILGGGIFILLPIEGSLIDLSGSPWPGQTLAVELAERLNNRSSLDVT